MLRRPKLCAATEEGTPKIVGFQLDEVLALSSMRIKLTTEPGDKDFRQPQKLIRALRVRQCALKCICVGCCASTSAFGQNSSRVLLLQTLCLHVSLGYVQLYLFWMMCLHVSLWVRQLSSAFTSSTAPQCQPWVRHFSRLCAWDNVRPCWQKIGGRSMSNLNSIVELGPKHELHT